MDRIVNDTSTTETILRVGIATANETQVTVEAYG